MERNGEKRATRGKGGSAIYEVLLQTTGIISEHARPELTIYFSGLTSKLDSRYDELMKGRNPLPTEVKFARGTLKPCRMNNAEPSPPPLASDVSPPLWLSDEGQAIWKEYLPKVCQWVTETDFEMLARWCALLADHRKLRKFLDENGLTTPRVSVAGVILGSQKRPETGIIREIERSLLNIESHLGFSPSSRTKVKNSDLPEFRSDLDQRLFG